MRNFDRDFDKSWKRATTFFWIYVGVIVLIITLSTVVLFNVLSQASTQVQADGGLGKSIGHFVGDIQAGVEESK